MKRILFGLLLTASFSVFAQDRPSHAAKIMDAATATGAGEVFQPTGQKRSYQAVGKTSSGSGAAAVNIEVSDDCTRYIVAGTITLTLGTTYTTDGFVTDANWKCVRGNVTSISGTGATVDVWIGN